MGMSSYHIRFEAVKGHLLSDGDLLRYEREVSRLSIDVLAALKRCIRAGDPCKELEELQDVLDDELYDMRQKRSA